MYLLLTWHLHTQVYNVNKHTTSYPSDNITHAIVDPLKILLFSHSKIYSRLTTIKSHLSSTNLSHPKSNLHFSSNNKYKVNKWHPCALNVQANKCTSLYPSVNTIHTIINPLKIYYFLYQNKQSIKFHKVPVESCKPTHPSSNLHFSLDNKMWT